MVSISSALIAFFAGHARDAPSANRRRIDARDGAQSTRCGELRIGPTDEWLRIEFAGSSVGDANPN